jgi:hypothetical protein
MMMKMTLNKDSEVLDLVEPKMNPAILSERTSDSFETTSMERHQHMMRTILNAASGCLG